VKKTIRARDKRCFNANPPYVSYYSKSQKTAYKVREELNTLKQHYDYIVDKKKRGRYNSMNFFLEKGLKILSGNSILIYIVDYSIHEKAARNIRKFVVDNYSLYEIIHNLSAFENVTSDQSILSIINKNPNNNNLRWKMKYYTQPQMHTQSKVNKINGYSFYFSPYDDILIKIEQNNNKLIDYVDYTIGVQIGGKNLKYKGKNIESLFIFKEKYSNLNLISNIVNIQKYGKPVTNGYASSVGSVKSDFNHVSH
jgi:hypothetical protein